MRRFTLIFILISYFLLKPLIGLSQENQFVSPIRCTDADSLIFERVKLDFLSFTDLSTSDLVTHIALSFIGTPYVSSTLESIPEQLIINMRETDCILFVEMCTALAITLKSDKNSFSDYCSNIQSMRYRDGIVDGYTSRIHYTSEWILQNSKNGLMTEYTSDIGIPLNQSFSYMSTHPSSYKQLKDNKENVDKISLVEKNLQDNYSYYYIPQHLISDNESYIKSGDIICFISPVEGLDIAHVALAYWENGILKFIHASYKEKKVVVDKKSIAEYAKNGIRVVKIN